MELAAGKTYVLDVNVRGGLMEMVPARPGTLRLERLERDLPYLKVFEPIPDSTPLKVSPEELAPWFEACVDWTMPDRWKLGADDGR